MVGRWWWVLAVVLLAHQSLAMVTPRCDKGPPLGVQTHKSRPEGKFALHIVANPTFYVPGDTYTVTLSGLRGAKFVGFSVFVEGGGSLYLFGDALTKYSDLCPGQVTQASPLPKSEVQMLWTAPPPGSGCVTFRATVVESKDYWYQEDGPLSKILCEDAQVREDDQPEVLQHCCACDEAKYEVTFEGLWSRHTHPKDFPSNTSWVPRFSDVIGASHTTEYKFWHYGGIASEGLKQVAERGSTRMLESELKSQSQHIRTIIKARGISYPNVTGKTFAVFRVDNIHHLISLVSMIDPSPDWIVGVSAFELCLANCSWVETKVVNLYPWDVGTDSGITYTSPDMPTEPRDHIRQITTSFPSDPRSPFYDPSGEEMKPLARLYLTRQRLYEKSCATINEEFPYNEACEVGEWSEWSPCSATCGTGKKTRQRFYKDLEKAQEKNCNRMLTSRASCSASISCGTGGGMVGSFEEEDNEGECALTEWSDWSGCSVSCGRGDKHRFRSLKYKKSWKSCMNSQTPPILRQDSVCIGEDGEICPEPEVEALMSRSCDAGPWSEWSPCSVTCGQGRRVRVRIVNGQCPGVETTETLECTGETPKCRMSTDQARGPGTTPKLFNGIEPDSYRYTADPSDYYTVTGTDGPVVDCKVSHWSPWSSCSATCGKGLKEKTRHIVAHAKNGGRICPKKLLKRRRCNAGPCIIGSDRDNNYSQMDDYDESSNRGECVYSNWSLWSMCSASCGSFSVQQRTRAVDHMRTSSLALCRDRVETRVCNAPPCRSP